MGGTIFAVGDRIFFSFRLVPFAGCLLPYNRSGYWMRWQSYRVVLLLIHVESLLYTENPQYFHRLRLGLP